MKRESARLRHTLEIARLAGFDYQPKGKRSYGGWFSLSQLEMIERKLRELELLAHERQANGGS